MDKDVAEAIGSYNPVLAGIAAAQSMAQVRLIVGLGKCMCDTVPVTLSNTYLRSTPL